MATSKTAWTNFERNVALIFGSRRNPLSGANNVSDDGSKRPGDVILDKDDGWDLEVECKFRAKHGHHKLFRDALADANKHGLSHVVLFTKQKYDTGFLAVLDGADFEDLTKIPGVLEHFKKERSSENEFRRDTAIPRLTRRSTAKKTPKAASRKR